MVPVAFDFGDAAFVPDKVDEVLQIEAALGRGLLKFVVSDAVSRVAEPPIE